jgi:hypothetical protein
VQVTRLPNVSPNSLRWHPGGKALCLVNGGGIAVVCVQLGRNFGRAMFLPATNDGQARHDALSNTTEATPLALMTNGEFSQ